LSAMDRREFLRLAMMTSAMLAGGMEAGAATSVATVSATPKFAALTELAPGAVKPEGWLKLYLEKQAAELGSQLDSISWPFSAAYWAGLEEGESWWPWEQKAYWLDGAMRLALVPYGATHLRVTIFPEVKKARTGKPRKRGHQRCAALCCFCS